ncbi:MAG: hypothetical protein JJ899_13175 [Alphaproteobacteria bacterium]|nr:hypothetical protein [Alphaproteobacteria bacterium]
MRRAALAAAALALAACARSAPELPPDYGSVSATDRLSASDFTSADLRLTCGDIVSEQKAMTETARQLTGVIEANRQHNQVAGYFGGLFLFPLVAVRENPDEKTKLDRMQDRWDTLTQLKRFKDCDTPSG